MRKSKYHRNFNKHDERNIVINHRFDSKISAMRTTYSNDSTRKSLRKRLKQSSFWRENNRRFDNMIATIFANVQFESAKCENHDYSDFSSFRCDQTRTQKSNQYVNNVFKKFTWKRKSSETNDFFEIHVHQTWSSMNVKWYWTMQQFSDRSTKWLSKNIFNDQIKHMTNRKSLRKSSSWFVHCWIDKVSCVIMRQKLITSERSLTHWHKMTMKSFYKTKMTMKFDIQLLVFVISFFEARWW